MILHLVDPIWKKIKLQVYVTVICLHGDVVYGVTVSRIYDGKGLSDGRTCKFCMERVGS